MKISDAEFTAIVKAAADWHDYFPGRPFPIEREPGASSSDHPLPNLPALPEWATELRKMFDAFAEFEFRSRQASPLHTFCEIGSRYGMQRLETGVAPDFWVQLTPRAKRQLKRPLERTLARITRPCFALELIAFRYSHEAICSHEKAPSPEIMARRFVGEGAVDRLFSMFKKFPVLARLWSQLISQWCDQVVELLLRFNADRRALSRVFFPGQSIGEIIDLRAGLSDPHNRGRAVMLLRFEAGSIIYKPRPGNGEQEWLTFLHWMNARSFRPTLKAGKILLRDGYCWMEEIKFAPCKDRAAANRFYQRLGGMIAAAYLLRAVDCHRDNMIASDQYPVLVDAETLWHVSPNAKTQTPLDVLYQTGFLARSDRRSSWQHRSSVLAKTTGRHIPRIASKPLSATRYQREIITGFQRGWRCILSGANQRAAFLRRLQRLHMLERRWIHLSTRKYDLIRRASIQPSLLRSGIEREFLIARLCDRSTVSSTVIRAEIDALKRLDIPYFSRKIKKPWLCEKQLAPEQIIVALRRILRPS